MIPLESVLKDVYLLMRGEDVNEDLIMEFGIRALEHLKVYKTYDYAVCILRVENNQAMYPNGMLGVEHVLYQASLQSNIEKRYLIHDLVDIDENVEWNQTTYDLEYSAKITKLVQMPNKLQAQGWRYLPISDRNFDKSIICNPEIFTCNNCGDWWYPDSVRNRFITSFSDGYIAVTYYRYPQNEEGKYLIMDLPFIKDAIENFVLSKTYQRLWNLSVEGAREKYMHYNAKWGISANAAIAESMRLSMPEIINSEKYTTLFKRDNIKKLLGGYGKEHINMR